ncbi:MAG: GNAT family N-acetyltransferase [Blastochloris sp.]|nr:GNAT family N-acetyltransferase [Blastochloris sp.]
MEIRCVSVQEAAAFLQLTQGIEQERSLTLYQTGEAIQTLQQQEEQISWLQASPNSTLLAALSGDQWVGYAMAQGGELRIDRHAAIVVVEVVQEMQRKGVATALMLELEAWALRVGLHRLELTVLASNQAAIDFYFKIGFEREGVKRQARHIGNEFVDEWLMGKLLL